MKTGIELIADERKRQIEKERYSLDHDKNHTTQEFIQAAISYLMCNVDSKVTNYKYVAKNSWWPWEKQYWKPTDVKRNLEKAGALIAAAIDRLQNEQ